MLIPRGVADVKWRTLRGLDRPSGHEGGVEVKMRKGGPACRVKGSEVKARSCGGEVLFYRVVITHKRNFGIRVIDGELPRLFGIDGDCGRKGGCFNAQCLGRRHLNCLTNGADGVAIKGEEDHVNCAA